MTKNDANQTNLVEMLIIKQGMDSPTVDTSQRHKRMNSRNEETPVKFLTNLG